MDVPNPICMDIDLDPKISSKLAFLWNNFRYLDACLLGELITLPKYEILKISLTKHAITDALYIPVHMVLRPKAPRLG